MAAGRIRLRAARREKLFPDGGRRGETDRSAPAQLQVGAVGILRTNGPYRAPHRA